jgi:hypothetical protein
MRASNGKWYVRFVVDVSGVLTTHGFGGYRTNRRKALQMEASARQLVRDGKANLPGSRLSLSVKQQRNFLAGPEGEYNGESRNSCLRIRSSFSYAQVFFGRGDRQRDHDRTH